MGRHTRGVQRVRAVVARPVRCRGALLAAWAVWRGVNRKSVGTVADASAPSSVVRRGDGGVYADRPRWRVLGQLAADGGNAVRLCAAMLSSLAAGPQNLTVGLFGCSCVKLSVDVGETWARAWLSRFGQPCGSRSSGQMRSRAHSRIARGSHGALSSRVRGRVSAGQTHGRGACTKSCK